MLQSHPDLLTQKGGPLIVGASVKTRIISKIREGRITVFGSGLSPVTPRMAPSRVEFMTWDSGLRILNINCNSVPWARDLKAGVRVS